MIGTINELFIRLLALKDSETEKDKLYELKEHKERRTLTQNAYYWQLLGKVARVLKLSNQELHNQMIADYGYVDTDIKNIIMRDDIDWRKFDRLHLKPTAATKTLSNGKLYRVYYVMRGSSDYNTTEMSRLVDGMIEEAKLQGIETMPPYELELLRQAELEKERYRYG